MPKPRANLRLSPKLNDALCAAAERPGVTKTAILEAALQQFLFPEEDRGLEARLIGRMDAFDARQGQIEHDVALTMETLAHYVFYWLTRTDPIPEGERDAAHALGQRRFDFFIEQVAAKLGGTRSVSNRLADESDTA
jgi:predicted transcriptional regulator